MNLSGINFGVQPFANQYPIIQNQNMVNPLPIETRYTGTTNAIPYLSIPFNNTTRGYGYYIPYPNAYAASGIQNNPIPQQFGQQGYYNPKQVLLPNNINTTLVNANQSSYPQNNQLPPPQQQNPLPQNNNLQSYNQNTTQNQNLQTTNIEQIPQVQIKQ